MKKIYNKIIKKIYKNKDLQKQKNYEICFYGYKMIELCGKELIINHFNYGQNNMNYILTDNFISQYEKAKENLKNHGIKTLEILESKYEEFNEYKNIFYAICISEILNTLDDENSIFALLEILIKYEIEEYNESYITTVLQKIWLENTIATTADYSVSYSGWDIAIINPEIYNEISQMNGEAYELMNEIIGEAEYSIWLVSFDYFNEKLNFFNRYHLNNKFPKEYREFIENNDVDLNLFFKDLKNSLIKEKASIYGNPTKLSQKAMLILYHLGTYGIEYRQDIIEEIDECIIKDMLIKINSSQFKEDIELILSSLKEDWRKLFSKEGLYYIDRLGYKEKARVITTLLKGATPLELRIATNEKYNKDDYYEEIIDNELWIFK